MSIKCQVIMEAMERIAPRCLAESWDNVGLMVGSPAQLIHRILICLDAGDTAIDYAIREKADMVIAHHPLIFKPLQHLRTDLPQGRLLAKILRHELVVFSAHTNLDVADGGVNDVLAQALGLAAVEPLAPAYQEPLTKLAVFVPTDYADAVQAALGKVGAGHIGGYSHCSFRVSGQGSFLPHAGAAPFIGAVGRLESVDEVRIETVLPEKLTRKAVKAMLAAHPYEEVAYDLYPLKNAGKAMGLGRIGKLMEPLTAETFARQVKEALPYGPVRLVKSGDRRIKKVALCGGSGADFISKAVYAGADVLVTGDVKYHEAQKAQECGIHVIDAGHFGTEVRIAAHLAERLRALSEEERWDVEIIADAQSKDPFTAV